MGTDRDQGAESQDDTGAPPPNTPPPPSSHGQPEAPITFVAPAWVAGDWGLAGRVAGLALAAWVAVGMIAALGLVMVIGLQFGFSQLDLGRVLATVFALPVAYLGGVEGSAVTLTGLVLLYAVFAISGRTIGLLLDSSWTPVRALVFAVKSALVLFGAVLIITIVFDVLDVLPQAGNAPFSEAGGRREYNYVALVFVSFPLMAVAALVTLLRRSRTSIAWLFGLGQVRVPGRVQTSVLGAKRTLLIALPGLLGLWALGTIVELVSGDVGDLGSLAGSLLSIALFSVVLAAVDISGVFLVSTMSFFTGETAVFRDVPGWAWVGLLIVVVAFAAGGHRSARASAPRTAAEAAFSAALIGPLVAAGGVVLAILWGDEAGSAFATKAILLPLLWGVVAVFGALLYAQQQGLPSGVAVAPAAPTTSPPPEAASPPSSTPPSGVASPPPPSTSPRADGTPPPDQADEQG